MFAILPLANRTLAQGFTVSQLLAVVESKVKQNNEILFTSYKLQKKRACD